MRIGPYGDCYDALVRRVLFLGLCLLTASPTRAQDGEDLLRNTAFVDLHPEAVQLLSLAERSARTAGIGTAAVS